ncbi:uncharacterized protein EDB93DRAFT_1107923 [Suillus bovinus]|uniref:uncharacterized protein n=1 Tax=Suillus bovinus TaxID=48563 RepID=UPI001B86AD6E|nr:uncharacterized protein EDB93DRAFT_1107923 [Suillus bovinus]KAG2132287.1 hypothetical protein EDB93DRAFT_1107923 [Suillus bovinus]
MEALEKNFAQRASCRTLQSQNMLSTACIRFDAAQAVRWPGYWARPSANGTFTSAGRYNRANVSYDIAVIDWPLHTVRYGCIAKPSNFMGFKTTRGVKATREAGVKTFNYHLAKASDVTVVAPSITGVTKLDLDVKCGQVLH